MARILKYRWYEMEFEDRRDVRENTLQRKLLIKTDVRVAWSRLRLLRPVPRHGDEDNWEAGFFLDYVQGRHKSRLVWELDLYYTPFKGQQRDRDPLQRPAVITGQTSLIELPSNRDWKGMPIVTTAGEPLLGIMRQIPAVDYTVKKNLSQDPQWLLTHLGAVNSDIVTLRGLPWKPRTLLLSAVQLGEYTTEDRSTYSEFLLTINANPLTWSQEVFNVGTLQLLPFEEQRNGKKITVYRQVPILEGDPPAPVQEPVPLDEFGRYAGDSFQKSSKQPLKPTKLISLNFHVQPELRFNNILPLK